MITHVSQKRPLISIFASLKQGELFRFVSDPTVGATYMKTNLPDDAVNLQSGCVSTVSPHVKVVRLTQIGPLELQEE